MSVSGKICRKKVEEKLIANINNLMESMKWSVEQAMDALKLSTSERAYPQKNVILAFRC